MRSRDGQSRDAATRLADLLADERGAQILAEIQKLNRTRWAPEAPAPDGPADDDGPAIGVWDAEATADGVALRRRDDRPEWWRWADVAYVPPPGDAGRVVLAGESVARGWLLEPGFTPALALRRHLPQQVVDLARSNIDIATLRGVVRRLPRAAPDVAVIFAGNNFTFAPLDDSYRDLLAGALRDGGYAEMRRAYRNEIVLPQVDALLDDIARLRHEHGVEVVLVVPETNLRGWVPAAGIEVPALPQDRLGRWYDRHDAATAAAAAGDWTSAYEAYAAMAGADGGLSPVSAYGQGQAAARLGRGAEARGLLEKARDATCGLLLDHVTGITTAVRSRMLDFAADHDLRVVDAAGPLAGRDDPELPDPYAFLDHIHLSDDGIEKVMARVADAVLGRAPGTTRPGTGADPRTRAIGRSLAAGYAALRGQPDAFVRYQLDRAMEADAEATAEFVSAYLDVLESPGIRWTHPAIADLSDNPQTRQVCFQVAQSRGHSGGYWAYRRVAREVLHRDRQARDACWHRVDLLRLADGRGFRSAAFTPGKAYYDADARHSSFAWALDRPSEATLRLSYRLPHGEASVTVNGTPLGALPAAAGWTARALEIPATALREGINELQIRWPIPEVDAYAQVTSDADALAAHGFPRVIPSYGALFTAYVETSATPAGTPLAARTDSSAVWSALAG